MNIYYRCSYDLSDPTSDQTNPPTDRGFALVLVATITPTTYRTSDTPTKETCHAH